MKPHLNISIDILLMEFHIADTALFYELYSLETLKIDMEYDIDALKKNFMLKSRNSIIFNLTTVTIYFSLPLRYFEIKCVKLNSNCLRVEQGDEISTSGFGLIKKIVGNVTELKKFVRDFVRDFICYLVHVINNFSERYIMQG